MNMLVMDKSKHKLTSTCDCCGETMVHKIGTLTEMIHGRQIRILNAPYYECFSCGEIAYDLSSKISTVLATAYRNGQTEIDYAKFFG